MHNIYSFIAGAGFFMFWWSVWCIIYEIVRHKSMLEYQFPNIITKGDLMFCCIGLAVWMGGTILA